MMKKAIVGSMFLLLAQGCLEEGGSKGQSKGSSALFTAYDSTQGGCLQSSSGMNCNHYKDMNSVYVTGSNANDGEYFFAVLTPGSQNGGFFEGAQGNLSDTVAWSANGDLGKGDQKSNRTFTVLNGRVTYSGSHHIGRDTLGRPIVQLAPFDRTDNPGGVYKVAVCMKDATGPSSCKYDSFKKIGRAHV